jgi:hypothetical protein
MLAPSQRERQPGSTLEGRERDHPGIHVDAQRRDIPANDIPAI